MPIAPQQSSMLSHHLVQRSQNNNWYKHKDPIVVRRTQDVHVANDLLEKLRNATKKRYWTIVLTEFLSPDLYIDVI